VKGGDHFLPFAVQDYRTSKVRARAIRTGDKDLRTFYLELLFALAETGGSLPVDSEVLADETGVEIQAVTRCLPILEEIGKTGRGGIVVAEGRVSNRRLTETISERDAYRRRQAEHGRKGGRPKGSGKGTLNQEQATHNHPFQTSENPPSKSRSIQDQPFSESDKQSKDSAKQKRLAFSKEKGLKGSRPSPTPIPSPSPSPEQMVGRNPENPNFNWSTEACDLWRERFTGSVIPGDAICQFLKPLVDEHGWPEVREAWRRYLAQVEAHRVSPKWFAATYGGWSGRSPDPPRPGQRLSSAEKTVQVTRDYIRKLEDEENAATIKPKGLGGDRGLFLPGVEPDSD